MIEYEYYELANVIYAGLLQLITAYFFYKFCRIFISTNRVWLVTFIYLVTVLTLENISGDISNFGVYLFASFTALLVLLPIKNGSIPLKLFIVITYFSIRWMAPTVIITVYSPINKISFNLLESWVIPTTNHMELAYFSYTIVMMILMVILYFAALWLVIYFYQKYMDQNKRLLNTRELIILIIPALSGMSSYAMMNKYHLILRDDQSPMILQQFHGYWALHNMITLIAMFTMLMLIQKLDQKRRQEQKALVWMNQSNQLQQHLASIDALYQEMKYMKHDLHNHLAVIESLIDNKNYSEAAVYLESINTEANQVLPATKSGNAIIDMLLQEKTKQTQQINTILHSKLVYPQFVDVDVYDLSIVLHNALDNAIRATKHIDGAQIELVSIQHKTSYLLTIRNPFIEPLKWHDGRLMSNKLDSINEGLGLQIIQDIANKYHGNVDTEITDNVFELNVLFLLNKSTNVPLK